jgi:hypothetical protein
MLLYEMFAIGIAVVLVVAADDQGRQTQKITFSNVH